LCIKEFADLISYYKTFLNCKTFISVLQLIYFNTLTLIVTFISDSNNKPAFTCALKAFADLISHDNYVFFITILVIHYFRLFRENIPSCNISISASIKVLDQRDNVRTGTGPS